MSCGKKYSFFDMILKKELTIICGDKGPCYDCLKEKKDSGSTEITNNNQEMQGSSSMDGEPGLRRKPVLDTGEEGCSVNSSTKGKTEADIGSNAPPSPVASSNAKEANK